MGCRQGQELLQYRQQAIRALLGLGLQGHIGNGQDARQGDGIPKLGQGLGIGGSQGKQIASGEAGDHHPGFPAHELQIPPAAAGLRAVGKPLGKAGGIGEGNAPKAVFLGQCQGILPREGTKTLGFIG